MLTRTFLIILCFLIVGIQAIDFFSLPPARLKPQTPTPAPAPVVDVVPEKDQDQIEEETSTTVKPTTSSSTSSKSSPTPSSVKDQPIETDDNMVQQDPTAGVQSWTSGPFKSTFLKDWNSVKDSYGSHNRDLVPDPAGLINGEITTVLQVTYPAKSRNPSGKIVGGTGFYAQPIPLHKAQTVTLAYSIFFPEGFNFVKGGKLPGLYGGHPGCSGGNKALDCFSTRFMFRKNGLGEIYLYVDRDLQHSSFCSVKPVTLCNPTYGASMGRGSYVFEPGRWTRLTQTVTMNSFDEKGKPRQDGRVTVYKDGMKVIDFDKVVWAGDEGVRFEGIDFETFFGGNDDSWRTPVEQRSYYKDFVVMAY